MRAIGRWLISLGATAALLLAHATAMAQVANVVAECPATRATPYPIGTQALLTVDQNGSLCLAPATSPSSDVSAAAGGQVANVVAECPPTRATPYPVGTQALLAVDQNGTVCLAP